MSQKRYIYFASQVMGDLVKIGSSINPEWRAREVGHGANGLTVLIASAPGGFVTEKAIHHLFRKQCVRGEWFKPNRAMLDFIIFVRRSKTIPMDKLDRVYNGFNPYQHALRMSKAQPECVLS